MNDFTQEELQILRIELNINFNRAKARRFTVPKVMLDLIEKINLMIESYCEHDPSDPILMLNKKCTKCGDHLETKPWGIE